MILDTQGTIVFLCQEAKSLLDLASHQLLTAYAYSKKADLLARLAQLCRNLEAIFRGQKAAPPFWCFNNSYNSSLLAEQPKQWAKRPDWHDHRASWTVNAENLARHAGYATVFYAKKVAIVLAQEFSNEKIGECLHIKLTTVKDPVGKIFTKLDIHRRDELLPILLALDGSTPILKPMFRTSWRFLYFLSYWY